MATDNYKEMETAIGGKVCFVCGEYPRVVWLRGLTGERRFGARCGCWPEPPDLIPPKPYVKERKERMEQRKGPDVKLDAKELF